MAIPLNWTKPTQPPRVKVSIEMKENVVEFEYGQNDDGFIHKLRQYYFKLHGSIPEEMLWNLSDKSYGCSLLPWICWGDFVIMRRFTDDEYHLYLYLDKGNDAAGELRHFVISQAQLDWNWSDWLETHLRDGQCTDEQFNGKLHSLFSDNSSKVH
jgi:hypothetical protein